MSTKEEESSTKEEEIKDQAQEAGGKVKFLHGGCLKLPVQIILNIRFFIDILMIGTLCLLK